MAEVTTMTTIPEPFPLPIYNVTELPLGKKTHEAIVDNLFFEGTFNLIQGPSKSGKSMLAYQLAWCLQNGHEFLGRKVLKRNCLYIDWELREDQIRERFAKITDFYDTFIDTAYEYKVCPLARTTSDYKDILANVSRYLKENPGIKVVFLDNFYSFFEGNQNDSASVKNTLKSIVSIAPDVTIFLVCHTNKAVGQSGGGNDPLYAASGSGAFSAFCDEAMSIQVLNEGPNFHEVAIHARGRDVFRDNPIVCEFGPTTDFCFKLIEDEERANRLLRRGERQTGKTQETLEKEYPKLAGIIGDDGSTLTTITKQFPDESISSLKNKGFWFAGKNKDRLKPGFVTNRFYLVNPYLT